MTVEQWLGKDNQLGIDIWHKKYQKNGETFNEWLDRVSGGNEEVKELIIQKKFLFGGRILSNRGLTDEHVTYSNCYVIAPPEDNIESIYESRKKLARTYSYGGGCGIDLSNLAPAGARVRNQAEHTTGAVSFMQGYSQTTEEIGQNGRRGALMISLDCHHPDLLDFIDAKTKEGAVTKANISVRVTDDFMQAVENDEDWVMSFTRPETGETITKTARAKDIFHKLCQNNADWAEPGILYWDRIEKWNLLSEDPDFHYAGVNPCAEEPLPAGGSCLLGSINLSEFVKDKQFDFDSFKRAVAIAVKALNDVLDEGLPLHPLKEQRDSVANWRQIGLGVMGIADMLIKMELPYDSDEAIRFCDEIGKVMAREAITASSTLAFNYGCYPEYNKFHLNESKFYQSHALPETKDYVYLHGLRNSQLLTIAPTGTLSTMLGISGGIEPIYANSYTRKTESLHGKDVYYKVYTPIVEKYMKEHNLKDESQLPNWFVTSSTIDPMKRITMQATWQRHIDASISSTVNLPNEATVEDIEKLYMEAWKQGLKGLTIYRDGCKRSGILSHKDKTNSTEPQTKTFTGLGRGDIIECSNNLIGKKRKLITGCVDCKTEYFNGYEWKPISEYRLEDKVLQYNADGTATLVYPINYIKKPSKGMYHIKTKYGLYMMISPDHRNVTFLNQKRFKIMTTEEIMNVHNSCKYGFQRKFKKSFIYCGKGISLTDDQIRLSIAIFADGCFYSDTSKKVMISVTKQRKRDRLINILNRANIDYSERIDNDGYYNIKFYPPIEGYQKTFPKEWYNCSHHQLEVIFEEVFKWDGYEKKNNQYTTIHKSNADFIQFVCSSLNKSSAIYFDSRDNGTYRVDWSDRILRSFIEYPKKEFQLIQPEDGYDYCFSVPSSMLVLRRNNEIFITGNCGSLHVLAFFDPVTGDMQEVYLNKGSTGGCANFMTGLSRTISLLCRAGVDVRTIKDQLDSTGTCPSYATRKATKHDTSKGSCCPMAIGNALVEMWEEMQDDIGEDWENEEKQDAAPQSSSEPKQIITNSTALCPECGEPLVFEGGCNSCKNCGYSKCN